MLGELLGLVVGDALAAPGLVVHAAGDQWVQVGGVGDWQAGGLDQLAEPLLESVADAAQQAAQVLPGDRAAAIGADDAGQRLAGGAKPLEQGAEFTFQLAAAAAARWARVPPAAPEAVLVEPPMLVGGGEDVVGEGVDEPQRPPQQPVHGVGVDARGAVLHAVGMVSDDGVGVVAVPRWRLGEAVAGGQHLPPRPQPADLDDPVGHDRSWQL